MEEPIKVLFEMGTTPLIRGERDTFEHIVGSTTTQMIMAGVDSKIKKKYEVIELTDPAGISRFYIDNRSDVEKVQTNVTFYKYLHPDTKKDQKDVPKRLNSPKVITFMDEKDVDSYINKELFEYSKIEDAVDVKPMEIERAACLPKTVAVSVQQAAPTDKTSDEYKTWQDARLREVLAAQTFNKQEEEHIDFWIRYKKNHSWFTGRKMHRRYEYNKRYGLVGGNKTKTIIYEVVHKLTGNEDEHVLPFGFMLIFGGGIARQVRADIRAVYAQRMNLGALGDFNEFVKSSRQDISLLSFHFNNPQSIMLMYILGLDTHEKQYNFCLNLYKINYYGYFLSEGKANSVKSDVIFLTLERDDTIGEMIFRPCMTKIKDFINLLERWSNTLNYEECLRLYDEQEKMKLLHQKSDESTFYNYNEFTFSFLQKGWRISKPGDFNRKIAENNMTKILEKLCCYLNDYIEERIAFNIIINHIMLKNKKPNTMSVATTAYGSMSSLAASTVLYDQRSPSQGTKLPRHMSLPRRKKAPDFKRPLDKDIEQTFFEAYLSKNNIKQLEDFINSKFVETYKDDWNQLVEIFKKYNVGLPLRVAEGTSSSGGRKKKTKRKKTRRKRRRKKKKRTRRKK
jgi:hypothetical protein